MRMRFINISYGPEENGKRGGKQPFVVYSLKNITRDLSREQTLNIDT